MNLHSYKFIIPSLLTFFFARLRPPSPRFLHIVSGVGWPWTCWTEAAVLVEHGPILGWLGGTCTNVYGAMTSPWYPLVPSFMEPWWAMTNPWSCRGTFGKLGWRAYSGKSSDRLIQSRFRINKGRQDESSKIYRGMISKDRPAILQDVFTSQLQTVSWCCGSPQMLAFRIALSRAHAIPLTIGNSSQHKQASSSFYKFSNYIAADCITSIRAFLKLTAMKFTWQIQLSNGAMPTNWGCSLLRWWNQTGALRIEKRWVPRSGTEVVLMVVSWLRFCSATNSQCFIGSLHVHLPRFADDIVWGCVRKKCQEMIYPIMLNYLNNQGCFFRFFWAAEHEDSLMLFKLFIGKHGKAARSQDYTDYSSNADHPVISGTVLPD